MRNKYNILDISKNTKKKLLVMAGGTGGHVFPALAMAKRFEESGYTIHWLGQNTGFEFDIVKEAGFTFHHVPVSGLRGKGMLSLLKAPWMLLNSFYQALKVVYQVKPKLVMGMGGYVTGPGGLAAVSMGCPLVIHEQNAIAGTTNKVLKLIASHVFVAFAGAFDKRDKNGFTKVSPRDEQLTVVGNPVRKELMQIPSPNIRFNHKTGPLKILVIGGSLGAKAINEVVPHTVKALMDNALPIEIWHQTGKVMEESVRATYEQYGIKAQVFPFISDMKSAYEFADLIICRAGALTISEIAQVGVASILIPLPNAIDNHQFYNAKWLASSDAAVIVEQKDLNAKLLAECIQKLVITDKKPGVIDRTLLLSMANFAYELREEDTVDRILIKCFEVCGAN